MNAPKIFISSTVYDFVYLRQGLKYSLEQLGFKVQLSERPDFDAISTNKSSYEICLDNIHKCQYFILLIGGRIGGYYDKINDISITRAEYEEAYELSKQNKIRMLCFVERDIWTIKEDRRNLPDSEKYRATKSMENPKEIFDFIDLVCRKEEMKKAINSEIDFPICNWIIPFTDISEIMMVFENSYDGFSNIDKSQWIELIKREMAQNMVLLSRRKHKFLFQYAIIPKSDLPENAVDEYYLTADQIYQLKEFMRFYSYKRTFLKYDMVKECLRSNCFLEYSVIEGKFTKSKTYLLLERIIKQIDNIKLYWADIDPKNDGINEDELWKLCNQRLNHNGSGFTKERINFNVYKGIALILLPYLERNLLRMIEQFLKSVTTPNFKIDFEYIEDEPFEASRSGVKQEKCSINDAEEIMTRLINGSFKL